MILSYRDDDVNFFMQGRVRFSTNTKKKRYDSTSSLLLSFSLITHLFLPLPSAAARTLKSGSMSELIILLNRLNVVSDVVLAA